MEKYIDVKVTVWNRYFLSDSTDLNEVTSAINDLGADHVFNELNAFKNIKILYGTETIVEPVDQQGEPTILAYEKGELQWSNGDVTNQ